MNGFFLTTAEGAEQSFLVKEYSELCLSEVNNFFVYHFVWLRLGRARVMSLQAVEKRSPADHPELCRRVHSIASLQRTA
jgi:hypothetical protein